MEKEYESFPNSKSSAISCCLAGVVYKKSVYIYIYIYIYMYIYIYIYVTYIIYIHIFCPYTYFIHSEML